MRAGLAVLVCGAAILTANAALRYQANRAGPWTQDPRELPFRRPEAEQVVAAIQTGTLRANARGVIVLPARWQDVTKDGRVYVTADGRGGMQILFPTYLAGVPYSQVSNFEGHVYSSRSGPPWGQFALLAPVPGAPITTSSGQWTVGRQGAYVVKREGAH